MSMNRNRAAVALWCAAAAMWVARASLAEEEARPWWDDFPRIVETSDVGTAQSLHGTVGFCYAQTDPSWGTYGQKVTAVPSRMPAFHNAGFKTMGYWETFGTATAFIAELGPRNGAEHTPVRSIHWNWQLYGGGPIAWIGVHNFFDDQEFARPYTRTHPRYGGPPMKYPDGTVATGYAGDPGDPRTHRVFDASVSKNVLGDLQVEYAFHGPVNDVDPGTGEPTGPLDGLLPVHGQWAGHLSFHKDTACPAWLDLDRASILMAADAGLDAIWTDNFSPWDSFGYPPLNDAFGEWSVATFRSYLAERFSASDLAAMGVGDLAAFDVRSALRDKARAWGGDDTNLHHPAWRDARWLDDPLWLAYLIHKRQTGTRALEGFYATVKAAAKEAGKDEFLVAGNDIPFYSLGWPRGELDMVSTEMTPGWHMGGGARGIMLPPQGRFAPVYKLAREHAKSRFVNIWMYLPGEHLNKPGLASALYYEMLAAHALPMYHPGHPTVAGTHDSDAAFFSFVAAAAPEFHDRRPVADVGIYYSSSSQLTFMTPGGFLDMNDQPHLFACWGWGTAFEELHVPYRFVPEWKLTPETLAGLRLFVVPDAEVFDTGDAELLDQWVRAGGLLVVTGESGRRAGESGHFVRHAAGLSLAALTGVAQAASAPETQAREVGLGRVLYLRDNLGRRYYVDHADRATLLPRFAEALASVRGDGPPLGIQAPDVPLTVGLTPYASPGSRRFYVDAHNADIDLAADAMRPTPAIAFTVVLPEGMRGRPLRTKTVAPGAAPQATIAPSGAAATVTLASFPYYASVIVDIDSDGDGLSDFDELRGTAGYVTDPDLADTDGDGINDGDELREGRDPRTPDNLADINRDGRVDALDIQLVVNGALGLPFAPHYPDVNRNGKIDAIDIQAVINAVLTGAWLARRTDHARSEPA